jgi:outer membrane receptor protein involved in Fe transport
LPALHREHVGHQLSGHRESGPILVSSLDFLLTDQGQFESANVGPYNGNYLPVHTTFDASAGDALGERWKLAVNVVNVTNHRVLLDNSVTIGRFHYNDPRLFSAELRYRFHF